MISIEEIKEKIVVEVSARTGVPVPRSTHAGIINILNLLPSLGYQIVPSAAELTATSIMQLEDIMKSWIDPVPDTINIEQIFHDLAALNWIILPPTS